MDIEEKLIKLQGTTGIFDLLDYLLGDQYIEPESSAAGITKKVLAQKSFDKLTEKQKERFAEIVIPLLEPMCKECGRVMDPSEALESYINSEGDKDLLCLMCFEQSDSEDNEQT